MTLKYIFSMISYKRHLCKMTKCNNKNVIRFSFAQVSSAPELAYREKEGESEIKSVHPREDKARHDTARQRAQRRHSDIPHE